MSAIAYQRSEVREGHKPWRCSYDVEDPRAQVFRPIGDGTVPGALDFIEAYVRSIGEYADFAKARGRSHGITSNMIKLLDRVLRRCTDFKTGRCEPSLEKIMEVSGFARPTVVSLLSKARAYGLVDWVRRTESTDNRYGPQRRQISNAYFFEVTRLPIEALRRLRQLLAKKKAEALEWPDRQGSGPVPNRNQRLASRIVRATAGMIGSAASALDRSWREKADQMRDRSPTEQAAILYPDDPASQREHLEMLGLSASSDSAPVHPSPRTNTS
jgi:hypothetical protein